MNTRPRILSALTAALLSLSLAVFLLTALVWSLGTSPRLMLSLMHKHAPPQNTALPAEEYPAVADMITAYLAGQEETFQHTFARDGVEYLAFQPHEQQHMADCRALFRLCRQVMWGTLAASVLLGALTRRWARLPLTALGLVVIGGAALALAIAAALDFGAVFVRFHRLVFTNDLWLLNPRTDLLIRLMPTPFFVTYAALIGGVWLAGLALMIFLAFFIHRKKVAS